ncbi:aromatic ring-hydroxylating dioxygenase subunit alpha [Phenylobacterium sp.]|uniref:aromatic ring-hydroxylating oxygenase subunit alpha n=1 Tax=Phenylobacterium sp. TaxID=1871053 RepID=UPI0011FC644E|nr:aromatic ring-hydroxylating dioxygenase subunit alpha [Phenylobacterium sp.]THD61295.1 MAG: aromatic ring-hydroxylating dioxygenase subunit alpha [Phenylobacterium sp.]
MPTPPMTADVDLYRDPAVFEAERAAIFARSWQFLGLEADLVRPGDYLAEVLAGYPVMVVRDEARGLKGYHNVCRHRAGPLVGEAKGRCDGEFVCRFHAWRYGFDGRLREATGFGPVDGFDPDGFGLFPIRVETWRGFVFVNLDPDAGALAEALAPLDARLGDQPRRTARVRDSHPVACNWKVYVENYLDGYHDEGIHPALAAEAGAQRHEVHVEGEVALFEASNPQGAADTLWAWLWPNIGLSVYRGVLLLEHMRPQGPDRTVIDHLFLHEPEDPSVDAAILNAERIFEEDAWINERVQQNLDAGVFQHGVLSPTHEGALFWFHGRVAQALRA